MFTSTTGHAVDKGLIHYARGIADAELGNVPRWSWGSAVLAATYRALCEACTKTDAGALFAGCPLLVQLWAAERFAIGRPVVDPAPYGTGRSAEWPEDGPTMGTYWCRRGVSSSFVHCTVHFLSRLSVTINYICTIFVSRSVVTPTCRSDGVTRTSCSSSTVSSPTTSSGSRTRSRRWQREHRLDFRPSAHVTRRTGSRRCRWCSTSSSSLTARSG